MNKLNDIFDKVYVITFYGSPRINRLPENLKDLDYEIFYGCNKNDLNIEDLQKKGYRRAFTGSDSMSTGVFACAFSHLYLYRKLKNENNTNNILILEDDAVLIEKNIESVIESYRELPKDWDVFFLGYNGNPILNYKNIMYKGEGYKMGDPGLRILECTHAFAINNNFINILIEKQENPEIFGGSEFWELFYKMNYFACISKCFVQGGSESLIGKRII